MNIRTNIQLFSESLCVLFSSCQFPTVWGACQTEVLSLKGDQQEKSTNTRLGQYTARSTALQAKEWSKCKQGHAINCSPASRLGQGVARIVIEVTELARRSSKQETEKAGPLEKIRDVDWFVHCVALYITAGFPASSLPKKS